MQAPAHKTSPFAALWRAGVLACAALLAMPALGPAHAKEARDGKPKASAPAAKKADKAKPVAKSAKDKDKAKGGKAVAKKDAKKNGKAVARKPEPNTPGPLADFGKVDAPQDVVHVANWVSYTRNNQKRAIVVIDKKQAQMYVFDPNGKLRSRTPVLLGKAVGDHTAPGVGSKPMSQLKEEEKTTPAGRFLARPGKNNHGEDIIWIDYDAAVSMHRLRKVKEEERRFERMATADSSDNRISNGCVNVPHKFYNSVLKPSVMKYGAFVYVLPETKTPQQMFASFDVPAGKDKGVQVAQAAGTKAK
mgnify:CR=1 FL=1